MGDDDKLGAAREPILRKAFMRGAGREPVEVLFRELDDIRYGDDALDACAMRGFVLDEIGADIRIEMNDARPVFAHAERLESRTAGLDGDGEWAKMDGSDGWG